MVAGLTWLGNEHERAARDAGQQKSTLHLCAGDRTLMLEWPKRSARNLDREPLRLVVQLVDARHKPSEKDLDMLALLDDAEVPTVIVATKVDKLKRSERGKNIDRIRKTLELDDDALIIPFSTETREGRKDLWQVVEELLETG